MKIVIISAALVLASVCSQANAAEGRACVAWSVLKLSAGCLKSMSQNFSPKDTGINYCPIPERKEIPTS